MIIENNQLLKLGQQFLGLLITFVSLTLKIPQIYTIIKKKSVKGLSYLSNYFDFYSILFQGLYSLHKNLSYLVYLEYFSTSIQTITIIFLYWYYSEKSTYKDYLLRFIFIITTILIIIFSLLKNGNLIPEKIWSILVLCGLPFVFISRVSQMIKIQKEKSVGAVSLMSFILRAAKNFIKVIVILFESRNWQLIINQLWYGILTLGVIIFYFKYKDYKISDEKEKKIQ
jgi:mannose-P-dolichol utilization defect protein 1